MNLLARGWEAFAALVSAPDVVLLVLRLTLVAALGHLALVLLRNGSAAARHFVATGTLAALMLTPALGVVGGALPALRIPVPEAKPDSRAAMVLRSLDLDAPRPWITPRPEPVVAPEPAPDGHVIAPTGAEPAIAPDVVVPPSAPEPAPRPFLPRASDWPAVLALTALLGAIVMVARRQIALVATLWVAHRSRPIEDARIRGAFERAVARLDVREPVALALTELLDVPAVVAFPSPRLLLPAAALEWDDTRLAAVFVHELAHVQRRDGFGFAVGRLATALLWFHPLVWTLARAARQDCERACDDVVLGAGVRASDYADELLAIARGASPRERWSSMSLAFARPSSLEGRLLSILRADTRRSPVTRRSLFAIGAALGLLLLPLATVRVVAEPYAKDTQWRTRTSTSSRTRTATVTRAGWGTNESASSSTCSSSEKLACNKTHETDGVEASGEKSGDEWYEAAKSHYDAKEFVDAGDAYERAATAGCDDPGKAWYNAACSWSLAGQRTRAVGALHAAIDNGFGDAGMIGSDEDFNAIHGDRRFQLLVQAAEHGHPSEESDGVHVSHQKKDWKEWKNDKDLKDERDGQSLDDLDPEDASQLRSAGIQLMRGGEPREAAKVFQREYAVDSSANALYNTACAYSIAGDEDRALMFLERSIYAGYSDRGHMERDDDLRAIRNTRRFDELADLAGDLQMNWPANGFDNSFVGPWRMLLPKLQRMADRHPDAGPAWFNLGLGELRSRHADASRDAFLRALSLGYRVKTTQYNLACAAAQGGDNDEAFRRLALSQKAGMDLGSIAPKDDDLEPLHDDSRWDSLMDRIDSDRYQDAKPAKYKSKFKS